MELIVLLSHGTLSNFRFTKIEIIYFMFGKIQMPEYKIYGELLYKVKNMEKVVDIIYAFTSDGYRLKYEHPDKFILECTSLEKYEEFCAKWNHSFGTMK